MIECKEKWNENEEEPEQIMSHECTKNTMEVWNWWNVVHFLNCKELLERETSTVWYNCLQWWYNNEGYNETRLQSTGYWWEDEWKWLAANKSLVWNSNEIGDFPM